jgi:hypothetical protein
MFRLQTSNSPSGCRTDPVDGGLPWRESCYTALGLKVSSTTMGDGERKPRRGALTRLH